MQVEKLLSLYTYSAVDILFRDLTGKIYYSISIR